MSIVMVMVTAMVDIRYQVAVNFGTASSLQEYDLVGSDNRRDKEHHGDLGFDDEGTQNKDTRGNGYIGREAFRWGWYRVLRRAYGRGS